jgi:hypothetical protein
MPARLSGQEPDARQEFAARATVAQTEFAAREPFSKR